MTGTQSKVYLVTLNLFHSLLLSPTAVSNLGSSCFQRIVVSIRRQLIRCPFTNMIQASELHSSVPWPLVLWMRAPGFSGRVSLRDAII